MPCRNKLSRNKQKEELLSLIPLMHRFEGLCKNPQIGIQPKGTRAWRVAATVRDTVRSERGKTEGIIGTLKSDKYKFNKPKERLWQTLEMAGPRFILSFNLHKLMRDLGQVGK